jgi:hypothetical protein
VRDAIAGALDGWMNLLARQVRAEGRRARVRIDPRTLRPASLSAAVREACAPLLGPGVTGRIAS